MPADLTRIDRRDADRGPPAEIDIYTGGQLRWPDVTVPKGLEIAIVDQRLEGHGFTLADGIVMEGKVTDLATGRPLAARVRLERIEPNAEGGYRYLVAAKSAADERGRWVLKKAPAGWHRVVVEADGFVSRIAGYARTDAQPRWSSYDCGLSRPAPMSGRIVDDSGRPLADVEVRVQDVASEAGGRYESPDWYSTRTDADGRFRSDRVPIGHATIWLNKRGYAARGWGRRSRRPRRISSYPCSSPPASASSSNSTGHAAPAATSSRWSRKAERRSASGRGPGRRCRSIASRSTTSRRGGTSCEGGRIRPAENSQAAGPMTIDLKGGQTLGVTLKAR